MNTKLVILEFKPSLLAIKLSKYAPINIAIIKKNVKKGDNPVIRLW